LRQRGGTHREHLGQHFHCRYAMPVGSVKVLRAHRHTIFPLVVSLAVLTASCHSSPSATSSKASVTTRASTPSPRPTSRQVKGGCDGTPLKIGRLPRWTLAAKPPTGLPFAISRHRDVVGILFGYPLRAGHRSNPANKVLWIVNLARHARPLVLVGRIEGGHRVVHLLEPADSGPGPIYPSNVDVPVAGCWNFSISWGRHTDGISLLFRRP
jgi:hypothetical protein